MISIILDNSFSKCSAALSDNVAIAIKPACYSFIIGDLNAYIINGTNIGNKYFTPISLTILPKQSSATLDKSSNYKQLSSNVFSQSFLSTSVNIFININIDYVLNYSLFLINAGAVYDNVYNPCNAYFFIDNVVYVLNNYV